jgi:hypothetical protein
MNFFNIACQEAPILADIFGLCDDRLGQPAYTKMDDPDSWVATVQNRSGEAVVFTAIDKCVINDHEFPGRGRCDGMLTTDRILYLVELKDQEPPWQTGALEQLRSTIQFLIENHDITRFSIKKVFACNKKRTRFVTFDNEENQRFMRETSFRKDFQSTIVVL